MPISSENEVILMHRFDDSELEPWQESEDLNQIDTKYMQAVRILTRDRGYSLISSLKFVNGLSKISPYGLMFLVLRIDSACVLMAVPNECPHTNIFEVVLLATHS